MINQPMQSIDLAVTKRPTQPVRGRGSRTSGTAGSVHTRRPRLGWLQARIRTLRIQGTLGPTSGDHVLGESQWHPDGGGRGDTYRV